MRPPFPPRHSHSKGRCRASGGSSQVFYPFWDFLPSPSERVVYLQSIQKGDPTCFQILERDLPSGAFVFSRERLSRPLHPGRWAAHHPCSCLKGPWAHPGPVLKTLCVCLQSSMRELVESGRYDTREDFSVVLQPFFQNVQLPVLAVCPLPSPMVLF